MKFCFATDAVNDVQQYRQLDNILNAALDGWHEWEIDDPEMQRSRTRILVRVRPTVFCGLILKIALKP